MYIVLSFASLSFRSPSFFLLLSFSFVWKCPVDFFRRFKNYNTETLKWVVKFETSKRIDLNEHWSFGRIFYKEIVKVESQLFETSFWHSPNRKPPLTKFRGYRSAFNGKWKGKVELKECCNNISLQTSLQEVSSLWAYHETNVVGGPEWKYYSFFGLK